MKIAILLHVYNGVEYLGEQLQSLLKQDISEKAEIKIIVRDDGSTDKTSDILDRSHREEKIEWIKGETMVLIFKLLRETIPSSTWAKDRSRKFTCGNKIPHATTKRQHAS